MTHALSYLCMIVTLLGFAGAAAATDAPQNAPVGKIVGVEGGSTTITPAETGLAQPSPAAPGQDIHTGDVIAVAAGGRAVIVLLDESRFTLGEKTALRITDYVYDDTDATPGRAHFSVSQGAFLYTSGAMAKSKTPDIKIATSHGTIGIQEETSLWAGPSEGHYSVFIDTGTVVFESGRGRIRAAAGHGTTIRNLNAIPERPSVWPQDKVTAARSSVALNGVDAVREQLAAFKQQQPAMLQNHKTVTQAAGLLRLQEQNPRASVKRLDNRQMIVPVAPAPAAEKAPAPKLESEPKIEPVPAAPVTEVPVAEKPVVEDKIVAPAPVAPVAPVAVAPPAAPAVAAPANAPVETVTTAPPAFPRPTPAPPLPEDLPTDPAMRQEAIEKLTLPDPAMPPSSNNPL